MQRLLCAGRWSAALITITLALASSLAVKWRAADRFRRPICPCLPPHLPVRAALAERHACAEKFDCGDERA
jgi:hypothetical protein